MLRTLKKIKTFSNQTSTHISVFRNFTQNEDEEIPNSGNTKPKSKHNFQTKAGYKFYNKSLSFVVNWPSFTSVEQSIFIGKTKINFLKSLDMNSSGIYATAILPKCLDEISYLDNTLSNQQQIKLILK